MKKILVLMALVMTMAANAHAFNKQYAGSNSVEYFIDFWKQILKDDFTSAHQDYLVQKYPNGCPKQEIILYGDYDEEGEVETIPADDVITDMVSTHYNYFQANQYPTPKYVGEIFARIYKKDYYKHISLNDLFVTNQLCLDLINRGDFERFMQNLDKSYYSYIDVESLTHAITEQDKVICSVLNACIYISMGNGGLEPLPSIFDGYYEFANAAEQEVFENEEVIGTQFTINQLTYEITSISTVTLMSAGKNITSVFIPSVVTYNGLNYHVDKIGLNAFYKCQLLTSVTIPESVTEIGSAAFWYCTSLTDIIIPESVKKVGQGAFSCCTSLRTITLPNSITKIENLMFSGCTSLLTVNIPKGVEKIGSDVFLRCTSLRSISIPEGVTSLGRSAFQLCSSLVFVNIPRSMRSIERLVCVGCSSLKEIHYNGTKAEWEQIEGRYLGRDMTIVCKDGNCLVTEPE